MAWSETLLDASFRGVPFEIERIKDAGSNALAEHAYPYRKGADVENLGEDIHKIEVEALFWGDDYEQRLQDFLTALTEQDAGELIHPVFGSYLAHAATWEIEHEAESPDQAKVKVAFWVATPDLAFFDRELPLSQAGNVGLQAISSLDALLKSYEQMMSRLQQQIGSVNQRLNQIRSTWNRVVLPLQNLACTVNGSLTDIVRFPRQAGNDVASLFANLQEPFRTPSPGEDVQRPFTPEASVAAIGGRTAAAWRESTAIFQRSTVLIDQSLQDSQPEPGFDTTESVNDRATLGHLVQAINTLAQVETLAALLEQEILMPSWTPLQVEQGVNTVREALLAAMASARLCYPLELARNETEQLKECAWQLMAAGQAVIQARPPLVIHHVTSDANLHLLAHMLYGDYTRAVELQRLNPTLRNPNLILAGEVLHVYSR